MQGRGKLSGIDDETDMVSNRKDVRRGESGLGGVKRKKADKLSWWYIPWVEVQVYTPKPYICTNGTFDR